jgi:hypothetical protein
VGGGAASALAGDGAGLRTNDERSGRRNRDGGSRRLRWQFRGETDDGSGTQQLGEKSFARVWLAHRLVGVVSGSRGCSSGKAARFAM